MYAITFARRFDQLYVVVFEYRADTVRYARDSCNILPQSSFYYLDKRAKMLRSY